MTVTTKRPRAAEPETKSGRQRRVYDLEDLRTAIVSAMQASADAGALAQQTANDLRDHVNECKAGQKRIEDALTSAALSRGTISADMTNAKEDIRDLRVDMRWSKNFSITTLIGVAVMLVATIFGLVKERLPGPVVQVTQQAPGSHP